MSYSLWDPRCPHIKDLDLEGEQTNRQTDNILLHGPWMQKITRQEPVRP